MQSRSILHSFRDAFVGIGHVLRTERNAQIQSALAIVAIFLAATLQIPWRDCATLAIVISTVIAAEMANTVVETVVDMISPGPSEAARIAKDAAAGTVLVLAIGALAVGLILLGPPLWQALVGLSRT